VYRSVAMAWATDSRLANVTLSMVSVQAPIDGPGSAVAAELVRSPRRPTTLNLVAEAKAGKLAPTAPPQNRPARGNNLSDGVKVAIGVGIAVALVILVVTHKRGRTYDRDLGCAVAGTC